MKRVLKWVGMGAVLLLTLLAIRIATELVAFHAILMRAEALFSPEKADQVLIDKGRYLATVGNCAACHTARGGEPYAGGKAIHTPFGTVYASNLTPDVQQGIGGWTSEAFYRAMHHGVSRDGRLLTPAFPYPNMTHVTRDDSDALHAYFMQGVKPVAQPNRTHDLDFPFNTQLALAAWRVLFFEAADTTNSIANNEDGMRANLSKSPEISRGFYLIKGLAHCSACHAERNALGASRSDGPLAGALMPMQDWYAPSLQAREEAGLQHWPREQIVQLLQTGVSREASVAGPMVEVVAKSTQYWSEADLNAAAAYLQSLPVVPLPTRKAQEVNRQLFAQGAALYAKHCATCHGDSGQGIQLQEGRQTLAIPPLAGNRALAMPETANLVRIILAGGYAPSTRGNPRPYGMPPFVHQLSDDEIASVATYIRNAWGNERASFGDTVSGSEVVVQRRGLLQ